MEPEPHWLKGLRGLCIMFAIGCALLAMLSIGDPMQAIAMAVIGLLCVVISRVL